ncbi:transketolase family protein [Pseudactinotalea suaedae]|uniref:transketolase family protein n=1 Tax=Pseudactinotalea suaedae TaxID=1524924 RepID=UPI0012E25EF0|nr:transketolase C-terminal domain-containing protein [Pseudactinotalea suaedae]
MRTDAPTATGYDNRTAFAEELAVLARADERIVAVCNDSVGSSNLGAFREEFGDRLINVGIAEQNMVGVGAGLAAAGLIPFVCGAGPFLTGRATEQVKADVAYSQHPVILCGMSPGMAYGELGPTHHSVEDLSWMRALPGLDIVVPADRRQTRQALRMLAAEPRPTYIRIGRHKVPDVTTEGEVLVRGRIDVARGGDDVAIVATGTLVSRALEAARRLSDDGVSARVLNAAWIAPLDQATILDAARGTRAVIVAEEANIAGGLGAAVAQLVAREGLGVRVVPLGLTEFAPTGSNDMLLEHFGLTSENIVRVANEALRA